MWRKIIATALALAVPAAVSAGPVGLSNGPIKEAIAKSGPEIRSQNEEGSSRARFWSGIALIAGGGVLGVLGSVELGDDEAGPDDGEDINGSDDGEDSDGWGNKALIGGGIAAATVGTVLLMTGHKKSGPVVALKPGGVMLRQSLRF